VTLVSSIEGADAQGHTGIMSVLPVLFFLFRACIIYDALLTSIILPQTQFLDLAF
jgi:hypothetical protein